MGESREVREIKQKILNSVYNIEQYLSNLKLDSNLVAECNLIIHRAHAEIDGNSERLSELMNIVREMEEFNKKLDSVVGSSLGFEEDAGPEKGPETTQSKDDTKPFKIFKG